MSKILIVGDSQAQGTPGLYAQRKFEGAGHQVMRIAQHSCGPIDWSSDAVSAGCNTPGLWSRYTNAVASFRPDVIVLIYGSNDYGSRLEGALTQMKNRVSPAVYMSGPPMYPEADRQRLGEQIRSTNQRVFGDRWIDAYPHTPLSLPRDSLQAHLPGESGRPWGEAIATAVMNSMATGGAARLPFVGSGSPWLAVGTAVLGTAAIGVIAALLLRR